MGGLGDEGKGGSEFKVRDGSEIKARQVHLRFKIKKKVQKLR